MLTFVPTPLKGLVEAKVSFWVLLMSPLLSCRRLLTRTYLMDAMPVVLDFLLVRTPPILADLLCCFMSRPGLHVEGLFCLTILFARDVILRMFCPPDWTLISLSGMSWVVKWLARSSSWKTTSPSRISTSGLIYRVDFFDALIVVTYEVFMPLSNSWELIP